MGNDNQSIKMQAVFFILIACALLIVSYSILVNIYFDKGLVLSVRHRLELEAGSYAKAYAKNPKTRLPEAANFKTYLNDNHLPDNIKTEVDKVEFPNSGLSFMGPIILPDQIHFIYAWPRPDGKELYFIYSFDKSDMSEHINTAEHTLLYYAVGTGVIAFLIIILIAMFMIRRITEKVIVLNDWAFSLNKDNVDSPAPDCQYNELNLLTGLIQKNMRRHMAGIRREQTFLRNASHELRTPVAVLQTNLDWLKRLGAQQDEQYSRPIQGMSTAVRNMKELTSTILWSGKKDISELPQTEIRIDQQLHSIITDNSYLLNNKNVEVKNDLQQETLIGTKGPALIIWSNIIRNAFQHTYEGKIKIALCDSVLTVRNTLSSTEGEESDDSFGLGLMLIEDLAKKMGWELVIAKDSNEYCVNLLMFRPGTLKQV